MAPLIDKIEQHQDMESVVCVTAQHREMLDQVINLFNIKVDYDLDIMKQNQTLFDTTINILKRINKVLEIVKPDLILVHGDTTTTFASSLAAFYHKIKIGHVEAGLRTYDKYSPFPEEVNRQLTDRLTDFYFAPTQIAANNLKQEGIKESQIHITGNTVVDAAQQIAQKIESLNLNKQFEAIIPGLKSKKPFVLITSHRRENFGQGFEDICQAIKQISQNNSHFNFIFPVHPNPNIKNVVYGYLQEHSNIHLIEPLDYLAFIYLLNNCYFTLTDSGGIQEEALSFAKPVLVMREVTERPEGVMVGSVKLVGHNKEKIVKHTEILINNHHEHKKMTQAKNPYGDGMAAEKIINIIKNNL